MRAERACALFLFSGGWRSGWARAWSWRNSRLSAEVSIVKGPAGGGPDGIVVGKKSKCVCGGFCGEAPALGVLGDAEMD